MPAVSSPTRSILLHADTHRSADQLYFGGVQVPDPFLSFSARGRRCAVVSALEFGRVKRDSAFDEVLPLEEWTQRAKKLFPDLPRPGPAELVVALAKSYRLKAFVVPRDFPAGTYARLRELGVDVTVADGELFPEREIKSPAEVRAVTAGNRCSAAGFAAALRVLEQARIRGGQLWHAGAVLTSERLRFAVDVAVLEAGGTPVDTIVAGGDQACDPHDRGSGPLRPHELIIIDIFPRHTATGYHGDMTRTFLKGRPTEAQRKLVATVRAAQELAIGRIRAGVNGRDVHRAVADYFVAQGYETRALPRGSVGYFHGTGHGLGLAVHEQPRMGAHVDCPLPKGSVVTVEPGLYYPGLGGCRVEDVVQVTATKPRMLSAFPYDWEIR